MRFKGFIGPAYTLISKNVEAQRCVNLYPEMIETGTGRPGEIGYLRGTPGLTKLLTVGNGPIRLLHNDPNNTVFCVSGSTVYKLTFSGSSWSSSSLGTIATSNGTVMAESNLLANGDTVTVFVDATNSYVYSNIASVETFQSFASGGYSQVDGATHVVYIDGYFIYNKPSTFQFYTSTWPNFAVSPLNFASAEAEPDKIVGMIANHRQLYLMKEKTTEVWIDTGNADFPFERVQSGFIEKGCVSGYSIAKVDGIVFWLGRDKLGQGIVYAAEGLNVQRISTHAIENAIAGYSTSSVANANAWVYHSGGHSFYVLNFSAATWVYDLTTKLWHERAYNNVGTLERHRGGYHAFIPQYNVHLVGDYSTGAVYQLKDNVYVDDTTPIVRLRSSPHVVDEDLKRVFCSQFKLDLEVGVGLDAGVQGSDPQLMLDWSDDGGHTWSNEHWASAGAIGKFKTRAIWRRLGRFRDRVFRVRLSDPVPANWIGASLDMEQGAF